MSTNELMGRMTSADLHDMLNKAPMSDHLQSFQECLVWPHRVFDGSPRAADAQKPPRDALSGSSALHGQSTVFT